MTGKRPNADAGRITFKEEPEILHQAIREAESDGMKLTHWIRMLIRRELERRKRQARAGT